MLPGSVAIVNSTFPSAERGKALGTMGGVAAIAGALGPTIGGALTSAFSWRLVLLVNVPLAIVCLVATLSAVPKDQERQGSSRVDLLGAGLLCLSIVSLVFGLTEAQSASLVSVSILGPVAVALVAAFGFLWWERRAADPLMDVGLLRRTPNYLGAMISQALAGFVEMGLGLIFPLLLILDLGMSPFVAGLALIPTTVPMVLLSTTVGRWYDRSGGRPPLVVGFGILGLSGLALAVGVHLLQPAAPNYFFLLPGLLVFGTGLAFVLTACDPVSLDSVDDGLAGQVSGASATAEQAGGAIGIAGLYAIFHEVYVAPTQSHHGQRSHPAPGPTAPPGPPGGRADRPAAPPLRPVVGPLPHPRLQRLQARVRRGVLLGAGGLGPGGPGCVASCPEAGPSTPDPGRLNRLSHLGTYPDCN